MNSHFATPLVDEQGNWTNHTDLKNVSSDISPTGGQMARALGIALASKNTEALKHSLNQPIFLIKATKYRFVVSVMLLRLRAFFGKL
jgi:hypothetical protein